MKKYILTSILFIIINFVNAQYVANNWQVQNETQLVSGLTGLVPTNGYITEKMIDEGYSNQYTLSWETSDICKVNFENKNSPNNYDNFSFYTITWDGITGNKFINDLQGNSQPHDIAKGYTVDFSNPANATVTFQVQSSQNLYLRVDVIDIQGKMSNGASPIVDIAATTGGVNLSDNTKWRTVTISWGDNQSADAYVNTLSDMYSGAWWGRLNNGYKEMDNALNSSAIAGVLFFIDPSSFGELGDNKTLYIRNLTLGNSIIETFDGSTIQNTQTTYFQYEITSDVYPYTATLKSCRNYPNDTLEIPNSVIIDGKEYSITAIGENAFSSCSGLTTIDIPNSVLIIGDSTFINCTSLTSITLPESIISIGSYAFNNCTNLTSITIPENVVSIGIGAFYNCTNLTTINYNAIISQFSVFDVPDADFYTPFFNCPISIFNFGNSVQNIPAYLCYGLSNLATITIPENIDTLGIDVFENCTGLKTINYNAINCYIEWNYLSVFPITVENFNIGSNVQNIPNTLCEGLENITSITIPNSVLTIGEYAFAYCSGLTSVIVSSSLDSIGYRAFYMCSALPSIIIPNSVTNIGEYAFQYCSSLTSINLSESLSKINEGTFYGCLNLSNFTISNSILEIEESAFGNCVAITSINLPSTLEVIGEGAFRGCSGLTSIVSNAINPPTIFDNTFDDVSKLIPVYVPQGTVNTYKNTSFWYEFFNFSENSVDINEINNNMISVINGKLHIENPNNSPVKIYDIQGKQLDCNDITHGVYVIQMGNMIKKIQI